MRYVLAAPAAALLLFSAAPASADNTTYLQRLQNEYGVVYDTGLALSTGYQICSELGYANGADVAEWFYTNAPSFDVPDRISAAQWMTIAVEELCPWHDHRYEQEPRLLEAA
jgi:hypothetical protein